MEINDIPVIGRINKTMVRVMINFLLLAFVCVVLAVLILLFPATIQVLGSALLLVFAIIFINIAYNIHVYKSKYLKFLHLK